MPARHMATAGRSSAPRVGSNYQPLAFFMSLQAPSRTNLPSPYYPTPYNNNNYYYYNYYYNYSTTYTIRLHPRPISKPNHPHRSLVMQMLLKLVAINLSHFHPAVAGVRGLAGTSFRRTRAADPAVHSEDPTVFHFPIFDVIMLIHEDGTPIIIRLNG